MTVPGEPAHTRSHADDPTRPNRRPAVKPSSLAQGPPPNYTARRAVVAVGVAVAVFAVVFGLSSLIGGDDPQVARIDADSDADADAANVDGAVALDTTGEDSGQNALVDPADTDDLATETEAAAPTTLPLDELPDHHGYRDDALYVALYGSISTDRLGVLGEADPAGSAVRAAEVASEYEPFSDNVIPSFEIIASVASFEAGSDGDYSNEASIGALQPWVDSADEAGIHVVLDLQSGRQRFSSQIREFEELLYEPHVSVALDPEWRVGDDGVPEGGKIGTVSAAEVNDTVDYLDDLIVANGLPPKMLIVHQFADKMITEKTSIRGTDNVEIVIHMDGFGPLSLKQGTYDRVTSNLPAGAVAGWKNFYDEDSPTPTPEQTMSNFPVPMFVSFQ